jgi:Predicted nucleic-acid-binding protein containing a Zn-ribbon domain
MDQILKYTCPKCGNKEYETGEMWTIGSFWTRIFKIYKFRFTFVSCKKCTFTEFYKIPRKTIGEMLNSTSR